MPRPADATRQSPSRHSPLSRRWWCAAALWLMAGVALANGNGQCARPLQVAVSDLGLGSYQEQGQIRGLIPAIMQELEARTGCPLRLAFMPRARALVAFDRGEVDIITSMLRTPERDQLGVYLPYGYTKHDLLVVPEAAAGINSLSDFIRQPELTLGIVRGIRTSSRIDGQVEQLLVIRRAEYSSDFAGLSAKLSARRVQAAMMPNALHLKLRRDGQLPADLVIVDVPEARPQQLGLYVNRSSVPATVTARLGERLAAMVHSGWVRQAYVKYFGEAETRRMYLAAEAR